jgi:hypothetical protein
MRKAYFFMRTVTVLIVSVFVGLSQAVMIEALAQAPAPGAGHGFLIDKHLAAGVTCAQCHTQTTATPPNTATCLSCHGATYGKLAELTAKDNPNPHASHQGELDCNECHHVHVASETLCSQCHNNFEMKTP